MLSRGTTECPPADNHDVEGFSVRAGRGTPERFVETVANVTPQHVFAEVSVLGSWTRRHRSLSCSQADGFDMVGTRLIGVFGVFGVFADAGAFRARDTFCFHWRMAPNARVVELELL